MKLTFTTGVLVQNNYSHHNYGDGFWFDINNILVTLENNQSDFNQRSGVFYEVSYEGVIRNNTFTGNGGLGIDIASSPSVEVYGNTVHSSGDGVDPLDPSITHVGGGIIVRQQGNRGVGPVGIPYHAKNTYIHNNTVYLGNAPDGLAELEPHGASAPPAGWVEGVYYDWPDSVYSAAWNNRFDSNTYYLVEIDSTYFIWQGRRTCAQWQAAGQDVNGMCFARTGPGCCITPGDADGNGKFNIADVTFGIARIFSGGPPSACQDEADANGDNSFNIADVTYGIARIFSGGLAPVCGSTGT
jgi:parallel beta-helix repeat protein